MSSRVMKKGKKSENRSNSEARRPTVLTTNGVLQHPAREGTSTYDEGAVVELVAEAEEGYRFVEWSGAVDTVANVNVAETAITMNDYYSVTANFEQIPKYDLIIFSRSGGSVTTPGEGTFTYREGEVVNLVAVPGTGYRFVNWTGDVETVFSPNVATTTITMDSDKTITARFEVRPTEPETRTPEVEYRITGSASRVFVTLSNATGGTEQYDSVRVPHTYAFERFNDWFLYISAQNLGASGSVTVTIYLNGEVVNTATSEGAYVIAAASHSRL